MVARKDGKCVDQALFILSLMFIIVSSFPWIQADPLNDPSPEAC